MPNLLLNATEVVDPSVSAISLVDRGANRIPIRFVKKDTEEMLDLSSLILKTAIVPAVTVAAVAPNLVGVAIAKADLIPEVTAMLKGLGIDIATFTKAEKDGLTAFAKADHTAKEENILMVKASDDVAFTLEVPVDFAKSMSTYDWDSTSFKEVMQKGTFAPSVCMAQDMLQRTFFNIMEKAEDPKELAKLMKSAVTEFEDYVVSLAKGLPVTVFKADVELMKMAAKKKKGAPAETEASGAAEGEEVKKVEAISAAPLIGNETKDNMPTGTDNNIEGSPNVGNETTKAPPTKSKLGNTASNDIEGAPMADGASSSLAKSDDFMAAMKAMLEASLAPLQKTVTELGTTVNGVVTRVQKTEEVLGGTVNGSPDSEPTRVRKSEVSAGAPPLLDTAFMKHEGLETSGVR